MSAAANAEAVLVVDPYEELLEYTPAGELAKLVAFLRRDFLVAWSYRMAFFTDAVSLFFQALTFWFIGKLVDPKNLPTYGGSHTSYMEFFAVGLLLTSFVDIGLGRIAVSIRQEQLMGTLESLLLTPTAIATIQAGSVMYAMIYIPIRTVLFFLFISLGFGLHFQAAGILPAFALLLLFLPFVWGLGVVSAAAMLTFRRGGGGVAFISTILALGSGAVFPIALFPHWVQTLSEANPIARAINGLREALIGGSWSGFPHTLLVVGTASVIAMTAGLIAFKLALDRERRRGTLGIY